MTPDPNGRALQGDPRQQYEQLVASIDGIVWEVDVATFLFTFVSQQAERLLGYPLEQWYEPGFWRDHLHPDDREWAYESCLQATREKRPHEMIYRMIAADGRIVWLRDIVSVVVEGDIAAKLRGIMVDVTERMRIEETLRQREADLRLALDAARLGEWSWNLVTGRITWSPLLKAWYGLPADAEISYERYLALIHPDDRERADASVKRAVETQSDYECEKRVIWPDGSVHWNVARGRVVCDDSGRPLRITGVTMDITERKRAEEAVRQREAYLEEAQRLSKSGTWVWNVTTRKYVYWSPQHYRLHGLDPQQGMPTFEESLRLVHPEDLPKCLETIEKSVQGRTVCVLDYRAVLPDGSTKYIHSEGHPYFNKTGELVEYIGTEMDVTERKQAEAALRDSEQRYREMFNCSSECLFLIDVDADGRFRVAALNPTEERAVGLTSAEVAGKYIEDILPSDIAADVISNYRRCVQAGSLISYDEAPNLPTGRKNFHTNLVPVRDETGRIYRIIGVARDVTAARQAEAALRHSEEMLRRAQEIGRVGGWVYEVRDGTFLGSEEGYRMCGWDPGTHRLEALLAIVHPDDLPPMQTAWQATLAGANYEIEHRLVVDGKVRWVNVRAEPEVDADGRVVRITGITQDITERKKGEEALRTSLREKEVLLKEVHHRVKNNLQLINSLLSLQAGKLKGRAAAEAFAESQNRVRAMALVHENLYRSGDMASVRLAAHLESLCAHLARSYNINPERIALDFRVAEVTLDLDRSLRLGLLVNELVSNAFKHAFPAGRSGRVLVQLDSPCVGCYSLIVSDNGVGISPNLAPGHSDSLGLQLIADLTEQLDGTLVLGREGGTTYSIHFPASCQEVSRS